MWAGDAAGTEVVTSGAGGDAAWGHGLLVCVCVCVCVCCFVGRAAVMVWRVPARQGGH